MPYRFLPDVALADIAFEADASTLRGLFESSGRAITDVMVDRRTLGSKVRRTLKIEASDLDRLLYDFLTEIIFLKDVESLLFREFRVEIAGNALVATLKGDRIDRVRHRLRNDVKAVTMHMFGAKRVGKRWAATVVLDI
jgi:SHS2 domain-containing protein